MFSLYFQDISTLLLLVKVDPKEYYPHTCDSRNLIKSITLFADPLQLIIFPSLSYKNSVATHFQESNSKRTINFGLLD